MRVPAIPVIGDIAITVFIEERRVIKIRMDRSDQRQNTLPAFKSDNGRIEGRRPDIGLDAGTAKGTGCFGLFGTGRPLQRHVKGHDPALAMHMRGQNVIGLIGFLVDRRQHRTLLVDSVMGVIAIRKGRGRKTGNQQTSKN